jgi:RHS repeat-associated protein
MTTTKQYDFLNRLLSISSAGQSTINSFNYELKDANQRVACRLADGSYWVYLYDGLGQVISGKKYFSDGTPVAGQQFEYNFDDIGNRTSTASGGDNVGQSLRPANYYANLLNQYTNRDVPNGLDIIGLGFATNGVSVNGDASAYRHGEYFCYPIYVNNSSAAQWQSVSVTASGQSNVTGHVFVPQTPETFGYDADGNMTNDGRWFLGWDGENRLIKAESLASSPTASKRKVTWEFSPDGRRIRQTTYDGSSGSYVVSEDLKFVNDGWRCIAELNATNNALVRSYTWGLDLSGSMDGAGGIGGLLFVAHQSAISNQASTHCVAFDGNGNVAALLSASDGTNTATYEYEPFGKTLRATGPMVRANPFRFSTKRASDPTDLVLYEMRPYSPSEGDFPSRDPAEELLAPNRYSFAANDPVHNTDLLGLTIMCCDADAYFAQLGMVKGVDYFGRSGWYAAKPGATFNPGGSLEKLIVWRMLQARHMFIAQGMKLDGLRTNVRAREKIVHRALIASFAFAPGKLTTAQDKAFRADPEQFFYSVNGTGLALGCQPLTMIIFESANKFSPRETRPNDRIWIPGDWGVIINRDYWRNPGAWGSDLTYANENVIHVGSMNWIGDLFWGHFGQGPETPQCEDCWFLDIKYWKHGSPMGDPAWKRSIRGPGIGLEPNSQAPPPDPYPDPNP